MEFELKTQYWDDPVALSAFKDFAYRIHGLDFNEFESRGFWDSAYTPFSLFDGETVVASMCIYSLDVVLDGTRTRLAQISGVGTLPQRRRQGLNRRLTDIGLEWAAGWHDGVFLFSNPDAIPFYQQGGFKAIEEFVETTPAPRVKTCPGAGRLDPDRSKHLQKIYEFAQARTPVSEKFGVLNAKLVMFHVLHDLRNCVIELPDLNCLVMCGRAPGVLKIYDIIGCEIPRFVDLYPYLANKEDEVVEFHFFTDKLGLGNRSTSVLKGNNPFVRPGFPVENPVFPYTSRA